MTTDQLSSLIPAQTLLLLHHRALGAGSPVDRNRRL